MFSNRSFPRARAPIRLKLPLEHMEQHDLDIASQASKLVFSHVLDLVRHIENVDQIESSRTDMGCLFERPPVVIFDSWKLMRRLVRH